MGSKIIYNLLTLYKVPNIYYDLRFKYLPGLKLIGNFKVYKYLVIGWSIIIIKYSFLWTFVGDKGFPLGVLIRPLRQI